MTTNSLLEHPDGAHPDESHGREQSRRSDLPRWNVSKPDSGPETSRLVLCEKR